MIRRLLITGGSGYLGRHVARRLAMGWPGEWRYTTFLADPLGLPQGGDHLLATWAVRSLPQATAGLVPVGPSLFGSVADK